MTDTNIEETRAYTKVALMRMGKSELIAVAGEIGVDLGILPKLTKESISDSIMVFLEPHLDYESTDMDPVAKDYDLEKEEITEPRVSEPEPATVENEEVKRDTTIQFIPTHIAIKSQWPARITIRNSPSGRIYVWPKAGATVSVAGEDVDHIMSMNRSGTHGCCGSRGGRIYFVLA